MNTEKTWHQQSTAEVLNQAQSSQQGLTSVEVERRLRRDGANVLVEAKPRAVWLKLLDQFNNGLVLVLLAAAVLSAVVGHGKDALVIVFVVCLNALLGFYQEHRAEATLSALKNMLARQARVRRDGLVVQIAARDLVVGDWVLLEAGDCVPADARVMVAHNVEVAEAALTGESHAVGKHTEVIEQAECPLAERVNMVFMNTTITRGRLEALVVATGMQTEMGRITGLLESAPEHDTPLQVQLDGLGKRLAKMALLVVSLVFALGVWQGASWIQSVMTSVALAVATIPEGLPAVVTVTLAIGMHRMAKHRAIVKKLAAVETLGSTTVICSDKTGTLTLNQMTARCAYFRGRTFHISGEGYLPQGDLTADDGLVLPDLNPLLLPGALCTESRIRDGVLIGDPTEGALLALSSKLGLDNEALLEQYPRIGEIPFDSAHKFMATFHHQGEFVSMYIKGAPDVLLARANLTATEQQAFEQQNAQFAAQAMRVLAVGHKRIAASEFDPAVDLMPWAQQIELVGLIGIIDPPRPEVKDAIALCHQAGIQVKMITGDHASTACAIAAALGIEGKVLTGADLSRMDLPTLQQQIEHTSVFARVAPEHKVKIVQALKAQGHVVAMTGDGVNDAPALKNADIGVAMGITGTEVTKEAATMVLADDNFASIVNAVREGRTIYENIVKFVRFQLSTNIAAILTVLGSQLMGLAATPFTAIQILWINIIMDGPPALTLGMEPTRPGVMREMPRVSDAKILTRDRLWRLLFVGSIMAVGSLSLFVYGVQQAGLVYGQTLAFTVFVLFQFFNALNARNEFGSVFNAQFLSNGKLWLALVGVLVLQVVVVHWAPAQAILSTTDLRWQDWLLAAGVASLVLWLEEGRKYCWR